MTNIAHVIFSAFLFILIMGVLAPAVARGENLLQDSSFERQLPADDGGWILFDHSRFSPHQARTGGNSLLNWGFSRTLPAAPFLVGSASGSYQEFPAAPGSRWRLTGFGLTVDPIRATPAFGIVQLSFFDGDGKDLGTVETADSKTPLAKTSNQVNMHSPAGEWIRLDTGVATAPKGTATVQAFTLFVDYSAGEISQGVFFDDLTLCAIGPDDDGARCE